VEQDDAIALIEGAVRAPATDATATGTVWADLGAGAGTFTMALASLLGSGGTVYAIDQDPRALRSLEQRAARAARGSAVVRTMVGDFTAPLVLPPLDGIVMANALHFIAYAQQATVLRRLASAVRDDGSIIIVEYDRRGPNPWVPYPIALAAVPELARAAGLGEPRLLATRPSAFRGSIYSVVVRCPAVD
jgi:SAM-dependent methyltransferase